MTKVTTPCPPRILTAFLLHSQCVLKILLHPSYPLGTFRPHSLVWRIRTGVRIVRSVITNRGPFLFKSSCLIFCIYSMVWMVWSVASQKSCAASKGEASNRQLRMKPRRRQRRRRQLRRTKPRRRQLRRTKPRRRQRRRRHLRRRQLRRTKPRRRQLRRTKPRIGSFE